MADPLGAAASASSILGVAILASEHILRLRDRQYNVRQLELDVNASLQKFKAWQETWSGGGAPLEVSAEALWGVKGWAHIRRMLDLVCETSEKIADYLKQLRSIEETKPRSRWKKAYKSIQAKQGPSLKMQQLQNWSTTLTRVVDELWIYSEAVFDSIHGVLSVESKLPERDRLLRTALRSRPSSLELHHRCSKETPHCSLEMDLLEPGFSDRLTPSTPSVDSLPVFYHLITRLRDGHGSFKKMTIESVEATNTLKPGPNDALIQDMENLQLFKRDTDHSMVLVKVASRGSAQSSHLRIHRKWIETVNLKSNPESLAEVLDKLQSANLSTKEHLSTGSKVELAYKLVECGFFLLGTPWLASLSSRNLLRLKNTRKEHHSFCLEMQTLDLEDLLHDDPGALAETSQLVRLGVLLMEIALDKPDLHSRSDEADQEADRISRLPLVEQSMGVQYCKATAFCLQYGSTSKPFKCRKHSGEGKPKLDELPIRETEKYRDANFDEWQSYLSTLLQQYHSQVYLRIQSLRDVDSDAEYRSVKSWRGPTGE